MRAIREGTDDGVKDGVSDAGPAARSNRSGLVPVKSRYASSIETRSTFLSGGGVNRRRIANTSADAAS